MKHVKLFEKFSGIENRARLSDKMLSTLNEQIKNELQSSQIYRAISCWLDDNGWVEASKYYFKSSQEELVHMDKVYSYLFSRNCKAVVPAVDKVEGEFKDIRDILEISLEHEIAVSEEWNVIADLAIKEGDNPTYEFACFFQKEQVEEEEKFRNLLFKMNLDIPNYELDELFGELV